MSQFLSFPVETCEDYVSKIRPRLKHPGPGRLPGNRAGLTEGYKKRDYALGLHVIGLFSFLRNLPGLEEPSVGRNMMCLLFDGPGFIHEMMQDWRDFYLCFLKRLFFYVLPDFTMIWEDICYSRGSLVSPGFFKEFRAKPLGEIISFMKSAGVRGIIVGTDGNCHEMPPI